jgi:hypothetical protein
VGAIANALQGVLADKNDAGVIPDGGALRRHVVELKKKHISRLSQQRKLSGILYHTQYWCVVVAVSNLFVVL